MSYLCYCRKDGRIAGDKNMILSNITTNILSKLSYEAGSSNWWTSAEIDNYVNSLYSNIALETSLIKKRSAEIVSVAGQSEHTIPKTSEVRTIINVIGIDYDGDPIDPLTISELNYNVSSWRSLDSGTPFGWFFERGNENVVFSLVPKSSTSALSIYVDFSFIPNDLDQGEEPAEPFKDGIILTDGVMSMALGKAGGGRDLDRSDWYWMQFVSKIPGLKKLVLNKSRSMKSIDEGNNKRSIRLGEHYPLYTLD
jgi:hypothetical protein